MELRLTYVGPPSPGSQHSPGVLAILALFKRTGGSDKRPQQWSAGLPELVRLSNPPPAVQGAETDVPP